MGTQLETGGGSEVGSAVGSAGGVSIEASGEQGTHIFEAKASVVTKVQAKDFSLRSI